MAASQPLLSVIVPCYKHEEYVSRALNSVFNQTYEPLELVIVDDASPDKSQALITKIIGEANFKKRFSGRVTFVPRKKNQGAHNSINEGISLAKGEYFTILNSDDMYIPRRLEVMMGALLESGKQFAFSRVDFVDEKGRKLDETNNDYNFLSQVQQSMGLYPCMGFALLASQCALSTGNFLFSRKLIEKIGPFADYKYCHDWDFILRAMLIEDPLYVDEDLYLYRLHSSNSFRDLSEIADDETGAIISATFRRLLLGEYENPVPPSPYYWPGVFESFLRYCGYEKHWESARRL